MNAKSILEEAISRNHGIVSPIAFNVESLHRLCIISHETQQSMFVRIDERYLSLEDARHWIDEYSFNYPLSSIIVVAEHITTFEEAIKAIVKKADVVAFEKGTILDSVTLQKIKRVAKINHVLIQMETTYENIHDIPNDIDIVKLHMDITDTNIDEACEKICIVTSNKNHFYGIDDVALTKESYKKLRYLGLAKFDVYETLSNLCMDKIEEIYKGDANRTDRFYIFKLKDTAMNMYCRGVQERIYQVGPFILR